MFDDCLQIKHYFQATVPDIQCPNFRWIKNGNSRIRFQTNNDINTSANYLKMFYFFYEGQVQVF